MTHLGSYPTPVHKLDDLAGPDVEAWVKRDDLTSDVYGGNKVRKLELLFGEAVRRGKRRVFTFGAAGSHHVLATARLAPRMGLRAAAILTPQPATEHALETLKASAATGAELYPSRGYVRVPITLARSFHPTTDFLIPPGASNPVGTRGYVEAANELARQVDSGEAARPDAIVVALGSGGTAAGLLAGITRLDWPTTVIAVRVVPFPVTTRASVLALAFRTARVSPPGASLVNMSKRLLIDGRFLGRGYGHPTVAGDKASAVAERLGLSVEPTYTAKAFAAMLHWLENGRFKRVMFWQTYAGPCPVSPTDQLSGDIPHTDLVSLLRPHQVPNVHERGGA